MSRKRSELDSDLMLDSRVCGGRDENRVSLGIRFPNRPPMTDATEGD